MTALQQQYYSIKQRFQEYFLFFKLGDFYELWDADAIDAVKILGITLTKRSGIPMCGIPVQNIDFYVKKLIKESRKPVAICDQKDTKAGNIVDRDVTNIYTKGTYVDMNNPHNNFLIAMSNNNGIYTLIYTDLGTEETYKETVSEDLLLSHLYLINPTEIIINSSVNVSLLDEWLDKIKYSNCSDSLSMLTKYLNDLGYYLDLMPLDKHQHTIKLSAMTLHNLEIFHDLYHNSKNSLLSILDNTSCAMGFRTLKQILSNPLCNKRQIEDHYDGIEYFIKKIKSNEIIKFPIGDLEKMINKLTEPKLMRTFMESIESSFKIITSLENLPDFLQKKINEISSLTIPNHILNILVENPGDIGSGNVFANSQQAQELNEKHDSILKQIHQIPTNLNINAKVKNNSLIGFFIESKQNLPHLILKQKSENFYRYTDQTLINLEQQLINLEQQMKQLESLLFQDLQKLIQSNKQLLLKFIKLIGLIDYYASFGYICLKNKYYRPEIVNYKTIEMLDSRHPVIESQTHNFITNNIVLDDSKTMFLITGPNMGGKSTILRQVAINMLMAHCGMFTSCKLKFSLISGLFVRLGAQDRIHKGESTFKVEMLECGEILNLADHNALIIMDEVGRGTSTQDGMSISFSIMEYIHDKLRCFSLISTHYNELSRLSSSLSRLENKKMTIENNHFTYTMINGVSTNSFGIHVAEQSNLPISIIKRSKEYFNNINITIDINKNNVT